MLALSTMKTIVLTGVARTDVLSAGDGALVVLDTVEGPLELRLTFDDAQALIEALHGAREQLQRERVQSARPPLPDAPKPVERWETTLDPINQEAVLRAHHADRSTRETRIARPDVRAIADFLEQACRRFESSADLRQ